MAICDYPAGSGRRKNGRMGLSANRHGFVLLIHNYYNKTRLAGISNQSDLVMKVFSQYRMKRLPKVFADCYTGRAGEIPAFN